MYDDPCTSLFMPMQQLPGFVKFLTVADIPSGGTNCFISERDIPEEVKHFVLANAQRHMIVQLDFHCRFLLKSTLLMLAKPSELLLQVYSLIHSTELEYMA